MTSTYHQGPLHDTLSGADENAPYFSRGLALLESAAAERERGLLIDDNRMLLDLMAENRETTMRLVRMEAERTKEQKERGDLLEKQFDAVREQATWRMRVAAALAIGYPVLWVVTQ